MATIITKNSSTASSVPLNTQLVQGELAVNVTDKRLFTENASGTVVELGTNPSSLTLPNGTANGLAFLNASKVLTTGSALQFDGSSLGIGRAATVGLDLYTASPQIRVQGTGTSSDFRMNAAYGGANLAALGTTGDSDVMFFRWGTEGMRLTSTGLGIGTSSPAAKLHVNGDSAIAGNLFMTSLGVWFDSVGSYTTGIYKSSNNMLFNTNGSTKATLDSSGNLGLGVTPSARLDIAMPDGAGSPRARVGQLSDNPYYELQRWTGTGSNYIGIRIRNIQGAIAFDRSNDAAIGSQSFTQAMTLDASGNLLVGTTTNTLDGKLFVESTKGTQVAVTHNNSAGQVFFSNGVAAAGTGWRHFNGVSSNNTVQNIIIYGNGNIQNANNSYGAISDAKLKENIVDATPKLEKLQQVRVVNYNLKGDYEQHKQLGVIAQELEQIFPGMVEETPDRDAEGNDLGTTTKSVKYSVFVPMLIKAIQEQQAIINQLKAQLTSVSEDVAALKGAV